MPWFFLVFEMKLIEVPWIYPFFLGGRLKGKLNEPSGEKSKRLRQLVAKKEKKEKNIAIKKVRIQQARLHK